MAANCITKTKVVSRFESLVVVTSQNVYYLFRHKQVPPLLLDPHHWIMSARRGILCFGIGKARLHFFHYPIPIPILDYFSSGSWDPTLLYVLFATKANVCARRGAGGNEYLIIRERELKPRKNIKKMGR